MKERLTTKLLPETVQDFGRVMASLLFITNNFQAHCFCSIADKMLYQLLNVKSHFLFLFQLEHQAKSPPQVVPSLQEAIPPAPSWQRPSCSLEPLSSQWVLLLSMAPWHCPEPSHPLSITYRMHLSYQGGSPPHVWAENAKITSCTVILNCRPC